MKRLAAICPLCQGAIPLPGLDRPREVSVNETAVRAHMESHTLEEWVRCTLGLRDQMLNDGMLRNMPRCAMPRA